MSTEILTVTSSGIDTTIYREILSEREIPLICRGRKRKKKNREAWTLRLRSSAIDIALLALGN